MSKLTKQQWIAEFERRTGREVIRMYVGSDGYVCVVTKDDNLITSTYVISFLAETDGIYSRAHLEAAVEAVGEVQS